MFFCSTISFIPAMELTSLSSGDQPLFEQNCLRIDFAEFWWAYLNCKLKEVFLYIFLLLLSSFLRKLAYRNFFIYCQEIENKMLTIVYGRKKNKESLWIFAKKLTNCCNPIFKFRFVFYWLVYIFSTWNTPGSSIFCLLSKIKKRCYKKFKIWLLIKPRLFLFWPERLST